MTPEEQCQLSSDIQMQEHTNTNTQTHRQGCIGGVGFLRTSLRQALFKCGSHSSDWNRHVFCPHGQTQACNLKQQLTNTKREKKSTNLGRAS